MTTLRPVPRPVPLKISIITVCRNDADALSRTLQTIAQQTYADIESIIIDGQSTDHTHDIVETAIAAGRVQKFISEADDGVYDAMNKGISLASGDVLYFLNADDLLADTTVLADVSDFWQRHPDCDLLYGNINVVAQHDGTLTPVDYPGPEDILDHLTGGWICHQAMFARRELFEAIGGFDLQYRIAADYDWLLRALNHRARLKYLPRPIANYRLGGLSNTDQVRSLSEMFAVQNQFLPFQEPTYLKKRLSKRQEVFLSLKAVEKQQHEKIQQLQDLDPSHHEVAHLKAKLKHVRQNLQKNRQELSVLETQANEYSLKLREAEAELEAIKSSKFWKLRSLWIRIKSSLGL